MQKILCLLLCLLLTVSGLCAAGAEVTHGEMYQKVMARYDGTLEQGAIVKVLENATAVELGYADALVDAFNETYRELGVQAMLMDIDQNSDIAKDGPYGFGPDVWYNANDMLMQYASKQHLLPLPIETLECYDQIPTQAWNAYKTSRYGEDFYCGVPVNVQSGMMFYIDSMLPDDWQENWDLNQNDIPDFFETYTALYAFGQDVKGNGGKTEKGYVDDLVNTYFSIGYLLSAGAYIFGNENTDASDIGFNKGDAAKGANIIRQWMAQMNSTETLDPAFSSAAYAYLANGTILCTVTSPDVRQLFISAMVDTGNWTEEEADADLRMITVPRIPVSLDLTTDSWQDTITQMETLTTRATMMGGINGYGISTYTQCPNASLLFVEFAASYEQALLRNRMLGIHPTRQDASEALSTEDPTVSLIFDNLKDGFIDIMPAIGEVAQIWTPCQSFLVDLCTDAFRKERDEAEMYASTEQIQSGLDRMVQQIYDAIYTLA
ncbi:MAG: hypothetical protein U0L09_06725 [Christensenellales bacterium]|nr:hypothetical protein [Christensenellales bacterium]